MKYNEKLHPGDRSLINRNLRYFVPEQVFDVHAHLYSTAHYPPGAFPWLEKVPVLGLKQYESAMERTLGCAGIPGLFFGLPHRDGDRDKINDRLAEEVNNGGDTVKYALKLVSPADNPRLVANDLQARKFIGIKVYHVYAERQDTMNASIPEYAPDWMWEILDQFHGVLMLHIVREGGIADDENIRELRRLCKMYPRVRVILAHIARSFNYRTAYRGLSQISDLDNVVVDTSAICESETFEEAIKTVGPARILWGSDFPVSELRGRCITTGDHFFWLHPEVLLDDLAGKVENTMTLVGIESLLALKEACENQGLRKSEVADIFYHNAVRWLTPDDTSSNRLPQGPGPKMWREARKVIAGGTALLSKHAEMFDQTSWPAYYSKSQGCEVWDMDGKRYIDFVGGVGSVLLGYADPDVNAAIQRRITAGSYSTLVNPDEIILAQKLLDLHPWAREGKVRFARTGGEAMAVAIRCARAYSGKSGVAFCGYHGWHDWYLAANLNESSALDGHLIPGLDPVGVPRELQGTSVPFLYNDISSFDRAIERLGENLAVVVMEPFRSQQPDPRFIDHIVHTCREKNIVLVVDEITSGMRYGYPGAHIGINLWPDIVVYAKAMSNGFPFGAIVGKKSVMQASEKSFISSSYWTDGVGTSAALAVLEKAERLNLHERVWKKGQFFQKRLQKIAALYDHCSVEIGGMPVTPSLTFYPEEYRPKLKGLYIRKMVEKGFLASTFFYLMDAHTEDHMDAFLIAFDEVLKELNVLVADRSIEKMQNDESGNKEGFGRLT